MNLNVFYLKYTRMLIEIPLGSEYPSNLIPFLETYGFVTDLRGRDDQNINFNIFKIKNPKIEYLIVHKIDESYYNQFDISIRIENGIIFPLNNFFESENLEKDIVLCLMKKEKTLLENLILDVDKYHVALMKVEDNEKLFLNNYNEKIFYKIKNKKSVGLFLYYLKILDLKVDYNIFLEYLNKIENLEFRPQEQSDRFVYLYSNKKIKHMLIGFSDRKLLNFLLDILTQDSESQIKFQYLIYSASMFSIIESEKLDINTIKFISKKIRKMNAISEVHEYLKNIFLMITSVNKYNKNFLTKQMKYNFLQSESIFIPKSLKELKESAIFMQNCSFSYYAKVIKESGCILYTRGINGKLVSCWYIQPEENRSYSFYGRGVANQELSEKLYDSIVDFFSKKIFEQIV